jgi:hypothetical protein
MLSVEELLRPRKKVMFTYPGSPFNVGDILPDVLPKWMSEEQIKQEMDSLDKFPAIFENLEWWEERKEEDMPEYLKCNTSKPVSYLNIRKWWFSEGHEIWADYNGKSNLMFMWAYTPISETEYLNQIKQ